MKARTIIAIAMAITLGAAILLLSLSLDSAADSGQKRVSMIIQGADLDEAAAAVAAVGGEVTHVLGIIRAVGADLTEAQMASLKNSESVTRVYRNQDVMTTAKKDKDTDDSSSTSHTYTMDPVFPELVGAADLHLEEIKGNGVTICVLDTGLYEKCPTIMYNEFLEARVLANYNAITDSMDEVGPTDVLNGSRNNDDCGHGSHLASILVNFEDYERGRGKNVEEMKYGIAPDANLVIVKAFGANGGGSYMDVIRGIDWLVRNKDEYGIRVLNCSFSAPARSVYWEDPLNQAIMAAWQAGIVVVASAGNRGPEPMTIGVPGNVPYVITVGAMSDNVTTDAATDDFMASFSSTGPTAEGFVKPEVLAPGGHLVGLMPYEASIAQAHPEFHESFSFYFMSGTSQSAAVVSGIAALMLQADPTLTPDEVKFRLMETARPAVDEDGVPIYTVFQQGAGMVNAYDAVHSAASGVANQGMNIDYELMDIEHYGGPANQRADGSFFIMDHDGQKDGTEWDGAYTYHDAIGRAYLWSDAQGLAYLWSDALGRAYLWSDAQGLAYLWSDSLQYAYLWSDADRYTWSDGMTEIMSINFWVDQE